MPAQIDDNQASPATSLRALALNAFAAYPIAAIFLAFGLGYLVMRWLR